MVVIHTPARIDKKKTPRDEGPVNHLRLLILSSMARDSLRIRSISRSLRASDLASCLRFSRSASASTPMNKLLCNWWDLSHALIYTSIRRLINLVYMYYLLVLSSNCKGSTPIDNKQPDHLGKFLAQSLHKQNH